MSADDPGEFTIAPADRLAEMILIDTATRASNRERDELLAVLRAEGFGGVEHEATDEPAARRIFRDQLAHLRMLPWRTRYRFTAAPERDER